MAGLYRGHADMVRLDANERNEPEIIMASEPSQQGRNIDPASGLIDRFNIYGNVWPQNPPLGTIVAMP